MSDVYVYVTEDVPPPLSTSQVGDHVNIDWSAGRPTGVEILGAVRVTVDGADVTDALSVLRELVAGADDHRCWWIPDVIAGRIRALVTEHPTDEERRQ